MSFSNQQPPVGPPPPGGYFTPPPPEYGRPPRRSAAPVVLGILNLVFALICGFLETIPAGMTAGAVELHSEDFESARPQLERQLKRMADDVEAGNPGDQAAEYARYLRRPEASREFFDAMQKTTSDPAFKSFETYTLVGIGGQIALLLSGILLLARAAAGRWLGVLACLAVIVSYLSRALITGDVMKPIWDFFAGPEGSSFQSSEIPLTQVMAVQGGVLLLMAILFSIYHLVALILMIFLPGMRTGLGRQGPSPAY